MKKLSALFFCTIILIASSCRYSNENNTNITLSESDHSYSMKAHFNKNKTRDVEKYMDNKIGKTSNMSFVNSSIDGKLTLDDHTTFYIKKYPGFVQLKFDKNENSDLAYQKIKAMCEGIKNGLSK